MIRFVWYSLPVPSSHENDTAPFSGTTQTTRTTRIQAMQHSHQAAALHRHWGN